MGPEGPKGDKGDVPIVQTPEAPEDTDLLWVDTDDDAGIVLIPGPEGPQGPAGPPGVGMTVDLVAALHYPLAIGHRGGHLLFPEHSMEGYKATAADGFPIEPDVQIISDGTLVVCHDSTTDRTMTASGNVADHTYQSWKSLRIKGDIPGQKKSMPLTIDEVLAEFVHKTVMLIESKNTATTPSLIAKIKEYGAQGSVIFQSFNYEDCLAAVGEGLYVMYLSDSATPATLVNDGIGFLGCSSSVGTPYITAAKNAGLKVAMYTVSDKVTADAKWAAGVDMIFSDDPWHITWRYSPHAKADWEDGNLRPGTRMYQLASNTVYLPSQVSNYLQIRGGLWINVDSSFNTSSIPQEWCGLTNGKVAITMDFSFDENGVSNTRWCGLYYGVLPNDDASFRDGATAGQQGYHFLFRRSGQVAAYKMSSGNAAVQIGSTATGTGYDYGTGVPSPLTRVQVIIDSTSITAKNLNSGAVFTANDTTYRQANSRLCITGNGTAFTVKSISLTEL